MRAIIKKVLGVKDLKSNQDVKVLPMSFEDGPKLKSGCLKNLLGFLVNGSGRQNPSL